MSYCVNCGVELDSTAHACPLCYTPVVNPNQPIDRDTPAPFPQHRTQVPEVSKWALALMLSVMFATVALCCGVLNIFLRAERVWSLYVIGAVVMLWLWLVPPLLFRKLPMTFKALLDVLAVGMYVYLISVDLNGVDWYFHLALPIILWNGAIVLALCLFFKGGKRSILTSVTLCIASGGVFLFGVELLIDWFLWHSWTPGWSLVAVVICAALIIPMIVVRRVPNLREEVRRRFHM